MLLYSCLGYSSFGSRTELSDIRECGFQQQLWMLVNIGQPADHGVQYGAYFGSDSMYEPLK